MRIGKFSLIFVAALPCACLEMPITHIEKTKDPVVDADAGPDAGLGPQEACFACMSAPDEPGPGCESAFTSCKTNEKCDIIIQCGFERECFQGSRKGFLTCGLPCVMAGGVLTG